MLLVGLVVCVIALIVLVVLCALVIGGIGVLLALGVVSSSVILGLARRRVSDGLRAAFVQVAAIFAMPLGIGSAWSAARMAHLGWRWYTSAAVGAVAGLAAGAAGGSLLWMFLTRAARAVAMRFGMSASSSAAGAFPIVAQTDSPVYPDASGYPRHPALRSDR